MAGVAQSTEMNGKLDVSFLVNMDDLNGLVIANLTTTFT
jgi:hypothetical protein